MNSLIFPKLDQALTMSMIFLVFLGIAMIFSVAPQLVAQQLSFFVIGLALYVLIAQIDYRLLRHLAPYLYLFVMILLVVTYFWGLTARGSARWITVAEVRIQASEIAKPIMIILLSAALLRFSHSALQRILVTGALIALPAALIFLQPDLGSSMIMVIIWLGLTLTFGIPKKLLVAGLILVTISAPLSWLSLHDYQKDRLVAFVNPYVDPQGTGYHAIQSQIAVGSGQWFGRGFGKGTQSHLQFLPEQYTDFIFATLAEELGFLGASLTLLLFAILIMRVLTVAQRSRDFFGTLISVGVLVMILAQLFINVGMNMGLVPITGITLPLVSYGGSSLLSTMIALGLVASVSNQSRLVMK